MKLFFVLKQDHLKLARTEAESLTNKGRLIYNLLFVSTNKITNRLAYTKSIYQHLFTCTKKQLHSTLKLFNWQSHYTKNFALRIHNTKEFTESDLAKYIWNSLKKPKVNLDNPKTRFDLFFIKNKVVCGKLITQINEPFSGRRPHLKPEHHPSSMSPQLARALVNLTGIQKGTFVDPFCGIGGILVEAGLMGFRLIGYDVDKSMLRKAETNLKYYKIKKYKLIQKDSTKIKKKINYIATDLPYGRSTKNVDKEKLYLSFLRTLKKILTKRAVIVFPHYVNYKSLIKKTKLKIKREFSYKVHHTLTRKIVMIERK